MLTLSLPSYALSHTFRLFVHERSGVGAAAQETPRASSAGRQNASESKQTHPGSAQVQPGVIDDRRRTRRTGRGIVLRKCTRQNKAARAERMQGVLL